MTRRTGPLLGATGSATKVKDRERVDGPNFGQRKECVANVLYAIRNGGYSGAPPNEKITWGKLAVETPKFVIESDATICAPLIFAMVLGL